MGKRITPISFQMTANADGVKKASAESVAAVENVTKKTKAANAEQLTDQQKFDRDVEASIKRRIANMEAAARKAQIAEETTRRLFGEVAANPTASSIQSGPFAVMSAKIEQEKKIVATIANSLSSPLKTMSVKIKGLEERPGFIEQGKAMLGESSAFGKTMKMMQGAGELAAVTMTLRAFGSGLKAANTSLEEYHKGMKTGRQVVGDFIAALPVIGDAYTAASELISLVTGQASQVAALEKATEASKTSAAAIMKEVEWRRKLSGDITGLVRDASLRNASPMQAAALRYKYAVEDINNEKTLMASDIRSKSSPKIKGTMDQKRDIEANIKKLEAENGIGTASEFGAGSIDNSSEIAKAKSALAAINAELSREQEALKQDLAKVDQWAGLSQRAAKADYDQKIQEEQLALMKKIAENTAVPANAARAKTKNTLVDLE